MTCFARTEVRIIFGAKVLKHSQNRNIHSFSYFKYLNLVVDISVFWGYKKVRQRP